MREINLVYPGGINLLNAVSVLMRDTQRRDTQGKGEKAREECARYFALPSPLSTRVWAEPEAELLLSRVEKKPDA